MKNFRIAFTAETVITAETLEEAEMAFRSEIESETDIPILPLTLLDVEEVAEVD